MAEEYLKKHRKRFSAFKIDVGLRMASLALTLAIPPLGR